MASQTASLADRPAALDHVEYRVATVLTTLTSGFEPRRKILPISALGDWVAEVRQQADAGHPLGEERRVGAGQRRAPPSRPSSDRSSTTGPVGTAVAMTAARSSASSAIGGCGSEPAAGPAVGALVVEHHPDLRPGCQRAAGGVAAPNPWPARAAPLVVPGPHPQRPAVREDHGQRRVQRTDLLDVQHGAVGGRPPSSAGRRRWRRRFVLDIADRLAAIAPDGDPLRGHPAERGRADDPADHPGDSRARSSDARSSGCGRRGTRAPIRVTIS